MRNGILLSSLFLLGCSSSEDPASLFRRGNEAYALGRLDRAEALWKAAARGGDDPGASAFNLGICALKRNDFREAERWFRRAEADESAEPSRKSAAAYHLGTALLAGSNSRASLRTAIDCFRRCLQSGLLSDELTADARHNFELAKQRYRQLGEEAPPIEPPSTMPDEQPPEASPKPEPIPMRPAPERTNASEKAEPGKSSEEPRGESPPKPTDRTAPGVGNLPVPQDADRPPPLTAAEGKALLDRIALRLKRDRIRQAELLAGPERKQIRDW